MGAPGTARVRAVAMRRVMSTDELRDLARLDPEAVAQVLRRSLAAGAQRR